MLSGHENNAKYKVPIIQKYGALKKVSDQGEEFELY
jgi:hypothetical protein